MKHYSEIEVGRGRAATTAALIAPSCRNHCVRYAALAQSLCSPCCHTPPMQVEAAHEQGDGQKGAQLVETPAASWPQVGATPQR